MASASVDAALHTDPNIIATISIEVSYDGGSTWTHVASATQPGSLNNLPLDVSGPLFQPRNTKRQLRALLDVEGGSFATLLGGALEET